MTPLEVLKAARELIAVPERWAKVEFAMSADGVPLGSDNPFAVRWCAAGACNRVGGIYDPVSGMALEELRRTLGGDEALSVSAFNDTREHADVLALFDRTIARLQAEAQVG